MIRSKCFSNKKMDTNDNHKELKLLFFIIVVIFLIERCLLYDLRLFLKLNLRVPG